MNEHNYYEILESRTTATADEIRAAYRRLALQYHPDLSEHPEANQLMQLLNEAYEVLSNPERKAQYDQERASPAPKQQKEKPTSPTPPAQATAEPDEKVSAPSGAPSGRRDEEPGEPKPTPHGPRVPRSRRSLEQTRWLRNQLKVIAQLIMLVTILFFWSLFTGQVNLVLIAAPVIVAFTVIVAIVARIRKPA